MSDIDGGDSGLNDKQNNEQVKQQTFGVLDLIRTPNMARKTSIITFIWCDLITKIWLRNNTN